MAFLGIPGQGEFAQRQLGYTAQQQAQRSQFDRQRQLATGRIGSAVASAVGTAGNPVLGGRLAAREAGRVVGDLANAEAAAASSLRSQQMQQEQTAARADMDTQRQVFGSLIGGAGQVLGMAVPAFGALNGAAGAATGASPALGSGVGGLAQSLVGGGAPAPTAAPLAPPTAAPMTPSIAGLGGAGPIGPSQQPAFSAPSGQVETFEERMRRLQLGGGFR